VGHAAIGGIGPSDRSKFRAPCMSELGQKRNYSPRAHVVHCCPESGHRGTLRICRYIYTQHSAPSPGRDDASERGHKLFTSHWHWINDPETHRPALRLRGQPLCVNKRGEMTKGSGAAFDPKTITLLKKVLAEAERSLPMPRRSSEVRVKLATGILKAAANGERDPARLRAAGLIAVE
jgi:hypothetical protein